MLITSGNNVPFYAYQNLILRFSGGGGRDDDDSGRKGGSGDSEATAKRRRGDGETIGYGISAGEAD